MEAGSGSVLHETRIGPPAQYDKTQKVYIFGKVMQPIMLKVNTKLAKMVFVFGQRR